MPQPDRFGIRQLVPPWFCVCRRSDNPTGSPAAGFTSDVHQVKCQASSASIPPALRCRRAHTFGAVRARPIHTGGRAASLKIAQPWASVPMYLLLSGTLFSCEAGLVPAARASKWKSYASVADPWLVGVCLLGAASARRPRSSGLRLRLMLLTPPDRGAGGSSHGEFPDESLQTAAGDREGKFGPGAELFAPLRTKGQPNMSRVIDAYQPRVKFASRARKLRVAPSGLIPPAPSTPWISPSA